MPTRIYQNYMLLFKILIKIELNLYYQKKFARLGTKVRFLSVILNLKKRIRQRLDRIPLKGIERLAKLINKIGT